MTGLPSNFSPHQ